MTLTVRERAASNGSTLFLERFKTPLRALVPAHNRDTVPRMAQHGSVAAVARMLREIEDLLKHPSVTVELGHRGVNASIAMLGVQGLLAYVEGNRRQAHDDLSTVTEEIRTRLERG